MTLSKKYELYCSERPWLKKTEPSLQVRDFSTSLAPSSLILDIGCGTGVDAEFLRYQGHDVVACDIDSEYLNPDVVCDINALPFDNHVFDAIFCRGVLHLVSNPKVVLGEMQRVLKYGGRLLVSYPTTIRSQTEKIELVPDLLPGIKKWLLVDGEKNTLDAHSDHSHDYVQISGTNQAFYHGRRLFIQTVSGCDNLSCSSPCSAYGVMLSPIDFTLCSQIIDRFRGAADIFLYGLGDASSYDYGSVPTSLVGCTTNLTNAAIGRTRELKALGLTVYIRCDHPNALLEDDGWQYADGVFCVAGQRTIGVEEIASIVLSNGVSFMVRSMCNDPNNTPLPLDILVENINKRVKLRPHQIWSYNMPDYSCAVPTVQSKDGQLVYKKCILCDEEFNVGLEDLRQLFGSPPTSMVGAFCLRCDEENPDNYRIYYEPNRRQESA